MEVNKTLIKINNKKFYKIDINNNSNKKYFNSRININYDQDDINMIIKSDPLLKMKFWILYNIKIFIFSIISNIFYIFKILFIILLLKNNNFSTIFIINGKILNLGTDGQCANNQQLNNCFNIPYNNYFSFRLYFLYYFNTVYNILNNVDILILVVSIFLIFKNIIYFLFNKNFINIILNFIYFLGIIMYILKFYLFNFIFILITTLLVIIIIFKSKYYYKIKIFFSNDIIFLLIVDIFLWTKSFQVNFFLYIIYILILMFVFISYIIILAFNFKIIIENNLNIIKCFKLFIFFNNLGDVLVVLFILISVIFYLKKQFHLIYLMIILIFYCISLIFLIIFYIYGKINFNKYLIKDNLLLNVFNKGYVKIIEFNLNMHKVGNDYFSNSKISIKNNNNLMLIENNNTNKKSTNDKNIINECYICWENESKIILKPCNHGNLCSNCLLKSWSLKNNCNLCNNLIDIALEYKYENSKYNILSYFFKI